MVQTLYFGVIALNLGCVLLKKKNALVALLSVGALSLVMGYAGTATGDLLAYKTLYESGNILEQFERYEMGYLYLNDFFSRMGLDFNQFRIVIFLICAALMYFTVKSVTKDYNLVVLLYTLVLFYFFAVALRFFLGFAIVIFACRFLLRNKWYHIGLYIGLVLLATQFHKSLYVALLFLVCFLPRKAVDIGNKVLLAISGFSLAIAAYMVVFSGDISFFANMFNSITAGMFSDLSEMSNSYFDGGYSRIFVLYILFYLFGTVCTYISLKYLSERGYIQDRVRDKIWCVTLICMVMSPAILFSQTIMRLMFIAVFMGFLVFGRVLENCPPSSRGLTAGNLIISMGMYKSMVLLSALTWFMKLYLIGDLGFNLMNFLQNNTLV